ncbi:bifunctional DNA primase/polymerase [Thermodesulfovibrio yellowstonii]|uniref:bifunctional DNA primase/polymerase n=1 Tax=Thermodesulfovibrio yellowstonii TaxID=28262 RepID=UPI003C7A8F58
MEACITQSESPSCISQGKIPSVALCYLRGGYSVVPLKPATKEPSIKWKDYQNHHMSQDFVKEFFSRSNNIAIITGEISGLMVVDVDDFKKFSKFYDFQRLVDEAGVIVKSPRGHHFWFKHDPNLKTKQFKDYGFDVKNNGALITVPPSKFNGHIYNFIKYNGISEIPQELKEKILALEKPMHLVNTGDNLTLEQILQRLQVVRQLPDGTFRCYCPAHDDDEPSLDVGIRDGKLYVKCWAGCSKNDVLQAIGLEKEKSKQKRQDTATEKLIKMCENFELWTNQHGEAWATLKLGKTTENYKVESHSFRQLIQFLYYQKFGKSAHTQALLEVIQILSGKAHFEGKKYRSFLRIGKVDDFIELDLAKDGLVARVTKDEIRVTEPICKFKRQSMLLPLPRPDLSVGKDDWKLLTNFINTDTNGLILTLAWLIGSFNLDGEFPILNIVGEREGVGKTTATKLIKSTIDPSSVNVKSLPKTEDDLLTVCLNSYIVAFDNLSHISDSASDALCRISTDSGLAKRRLFTDTDSVQYSVKNPIILNGIDLFAERRDLRRRCIHVELQRVANPKPINKIEADFKKIHGRLLGWLMKAVQTALNEEIEQNMNLTDMASFVEFICKTEKIFPVTAKEFVANFVANRQNVSLQLIAENPIVNVIIELVKDNGEWTGTANELYEKITAKFNNGIHKNVIPKDAKALGKILRRLSSDLEGAGIFISFSRENLSRKIHIKKISEFHVTDVTNVIPLKNKDFFGDKNVTTSDKNGNLMSLENPLKNEENDDSDNSDIKNGNFLKSEIDPNDILVLE